MCVTAVMRNVVLPGLFVSASSNVSLSLSSLINTLKSGRKAERADGWHHLKSLFNHSVHQCLGVNSSVPPVLSRLPASPAPAWVGNGRSVIKCCSILYHFEKWVAEKHVIYSSGFFRLVRVH